VASRLREADGVQGDFVLALRRPRRLLTARHRETLLGDLDLGPSCTLDVEDPAGAPGFFPQAAQVTVGGYEAPPPLATVSGLLAMLTAPLWSLLTMLGLLGAGSAAAERAAPPETGRPARGGSHVATLPSSSPDTYPDSTNNGNSTLQQPRND